MRKTETVSLPNKIREWRQFRELTASQLAERVGCTPAQLTRMETEVRSVTLDWMRRLARELDVTPGQLLSYTDNPHLPSIEERILLDEIKKGGDLLFATVSAVVTVQNADITDS